MDGGAEGGGAGVGRVVGDLVVGVLVGLAVNVVCVTGLAAGAAGLAFAFPGKMQLPEVAFFSAFLTVLPVGFYGWAWLLPLSVVLRRRPARSVGVLLVGGLNGLLTFLACGGASSF